MKEISFVKINCRYPEELADRSWDNVGLLLDNQDRDGPQPNPLVLVTNDLTYQVAHEAVDKGVSTIVSYRTSPSTPQFQPLHAQLI